VDLAIDAKPYDDVVLDTMVLWSGIRDYVSLDNLCFSLGIATKGDLDGSRVWDYVQDGRWQEVAEYCADDVERARLIYQRISLCEL
jgi:predicted PolB exonuclease-like 3'-5' exonuclease